MFGDIRLLKIVTMRTAPHMREINGYSRNACSPFLFLSRAECRTAGPILTLDGSFDADFAYEDRLLYGKKKEMMRRYPICQKNCFELSHKSMNDLVGIKTPEIQFLFEQGSTNVSWIVKFASPIVVQYLPTQASDQ